MIKTQIMNFISRKLVYIFLLTATIFFHAQPPGIPDPGDGGGGVGPGAPVSPIDMYVYALGIVGIIFIIYYFKRQQKRVV